MVFTTDAIFALVIVAVAVSILAYFNYSVQTPYTAGPSTTGSALSSLNTETPAQLAAEDAVALSILNEYNASSEYWTQFMGGPSRSGYAVHGPILPTIQYIFAANAPVSTQIVAGYGNVYFGAGNTIYAINASYGTLSWSSILKNNPGGLALYGGMVIYGTPYETGALNASTGTSLWITPTSSSQLLAYNGRLYSAGSSTPNLAIFNANNGTAISSISLGSSTDGMLEENGTISIRLASNTAVALDQFGSNVLTSSYAFATTNISASGGMLYVGSNTYECSFYTNLTQKFCGNEGSTITSVASGNGIAVYEYGSGVNAIAASGAPLWQRSMSSYGTSLDYPIVTNSSVYSIWSGNYVVDQNATNGNVRWATQIPGSYGAVAAFSAAYGNLYVAAGGNVIAYGACASQPYSPILQDAVQLYMEGRGSCATYLVDKIYSRSNTGLFINGSYAPSLNVSSFNGQSSYIYATSPDITTSSGGYNTVSFWMYWNGNDGQMPFGFYSYDLWLSTASCFGFNTGNGDAYGTAISANSWVFVTAIFYNGAYTGNSKLYINGMQQTLRQCSGSAGSGSATTSFHISGWPNNPNYYLNGNLANLQVYNTALNSTQVRQLYDEGISGAPVAPANIVGWWPLEGDANDYSGYNNTGYPFGVTYVQGNYLPPGYRSASSISVSSTMLPFSRNQGYNGANPLGGSNPNLIGNSPGLNGNAPQISGSLNVNSPRLYKVGVYSWS